VTSVGIDRASLELLSGCIVDYTTELIGSQLRIKNLKAMSNCGCGRSSDLEM
jgi:Fe-S cluster assembly iron-binding protein IscA